MSDYGKGQIMSQMSACENQSNFGPLMEFINNLCSCKIGVGSVFLMYRVLEENQAFERKKSGFSDKNMEFKPENPVLSGFS